MQTSLRSRIFPITSETKLKKTVLSTNQNLTTCIYCGSKDIVKGGLRKNKYGDIPNFPTATYCNKRFTFNIGFERMKHSPQAITTAMQLYFTGESLRNSEIPKIIRSTISHIQSVKWIKKYIALMKEYLEKINPKVSDTWRADEIYVKINGNMKYLFSMMDDETRFWIAQEVAETKDKHDARNLLRMSKELHGKKPMTFITDGLQSYHDAYKKEFCTLKNPRTEHIRQITLKRRTSQ